jgi:hypothetical protein
MGIYFLWLIKRIRSRNIKAAAASPIDAYDLNKFLLSAVDCGIDMVMCVLITQIGIWYFTGMPFITFLCAEDLFLRVIDLSCGRERTMKEEPNLNKYSITFK